ncbi:hypothetical protein DWB61_17350 [Ancylomarina euxinus]|uniref:Uncharacterized protein n=1 Tax=Ancylomarina euxinus TaxID=2283627 RepID=A0A425XWH7_9BACT|nr:hypothetical protein [Ancylomarina euxinus]MCZ4696434.1 hypothetical protein [Ancylomarina euxinus]MUP16811.1 hypothetical protein [Ancylomarina euxinus]RRG18993.1 hypothetical protein DWB61_17350 [Ancylomarina euxinus]
MKNDNPYKVPENYFDNLGAQIQEKIKQEENKFEQVEEKRSLLVQLKPYMWMAASIFVLVFAARIILSVSISPEYKIASFGNEALQANAHVDSVEAANNEVDAQFFDDLKDATSDDIIDYLSDSDIDTDILLANL